jgi:hypothetical protein
MVSNSASCKTQTAISLRWGCKRFTPHDDDVDNDDDDEEDDNDLSPRRYISSVKCM